MQLLLEEGADVDQRNVVRVCGGVGVAFRVFLSLSLSRSNSPSSPPHPHQMGETPLIRAAHNGHPAAVSVLLAAGAAVGAVDAGDSTPLHWSAMRGHVECVTALVKAGADVHARNKQVRKQGEGGVCVVLWWGGQRDGKTPPRPPFLSLLQDKTPADLCQPCWSPAYRYAREALSAAGA